MMKAFRLTMPFFCFFMVLNAAAAESEAIAPVQAFPRTALKKAQPQAQSAQRFLLVEFWTYNTPESRVFHKKVLSNPKVLTWLNQHAVGARINFDFNKRLRTHFHVKDLPSVLLLDGDLRIWGRAAGAIKPDSLIKTLEKGRAMRDAFLAAQKKLKQSPNDPAQLLALVKGYIHQEDGKTAQSHLMQLCKVDPGFQSGPLEKLAFDIGHVLDGRHQNVQAKKSYHLAATWAKNRNHAVRAASLYHLAVLQLRTKQPDKAMQLLELLLDEFDPMPKATEALFIPKRSEVMYVLATQYIKDANDMSRGVALLKKVVNNYGDRFSEAAEKLLALTELQKD